MSTAVDPYAAVIANTTQASAAQTKNEAGSADRFLKLLVAQMQNQDPLNPMDNAQVTSQMAQINTVNGIEKLNTTVASLGTQFSQMQTVQGAALVGREVTVAGKSLSIADGTGTGAFEIESTADAVKLEILAPSGVVVSTVNLGAQSAGRHNFEWDATNVAEDANYSFRITATAGAVAVPSTTLMRDKVAAVTNADNTLVLELERLGDVRYSDVRTFN